MTKDIKFIGQDPLKSDLDCTDGEIRLAYGTTPMGDGTFTAPLDCKRVLKAPQGYRIIAIHAISANIQVIMTYNRAIDSHTMLCYAPSPASEEINEQQITDIGEIDEIYAVEIIDHRVAIGTSNGLAMLVWDNGQYRILNTEIRINLEFGLKKIGHLTTADTIYTTADAITNISTGGTGAGASRPHPATTEARAQSVDLSDAVAKGYSQAIAQEVTSKGLFHQPFFVRYALRGSDDTILYVSSPMLMLPTVNPPRICVTAATTQDGKATLTLDLSYNNVFQLVYRATQPPQSQWSSFIKAIDIFTTLPINTYDVEEAEQGYITSYNNVLAATDNGGGHRGRVSRTPSQQFDGHFSLDGVTFAEHTLDESISGRSIWFVAPNSHLHDDIATASRYHRIATIDYYALNASQSFVAVETQTTDPASLATHPTLEDYLGEAHTPIPAALLNYNGQLVVGANSRRLKSPEPLTAVTAFAGNAGQSNPTEIVTRVYIKRQGRTYMVTGTAPGHQCDLSEHFPRYLYYPDRDAYVMTLTQGGSTWCLPLRAHDTLNGAYWWGGTNDNSQFTMLNTQCTDIGDESIPEPDTIAGTTDIENMDGMVYLAGKSILAPLREQLSTGVGSITRLATAVHAPQGGAFGDYPIYAIGTRGVQRLQYDDHQRAITATRDISDIGCPNPMAVVYGHGTVMYASDESLHIIDGSSVKTMPIHLNTDIERASKLPHAATLANLANCRWLDGQGQTTNHSRSALSPELHTVNALYYDRCTNRLIVSGQYIWQYDLNRHTWALTDLPPIVHVAGTDFGVADEGDLVSVDVSDAQGSVLLITRPIKLSSPTGLHDVKRVEILGEWDSGKVGIALYGANRLGRWHLIKSAIHEYLDDINTQSYRFHCLAVLAKLSKDEYITGASIQFNT